jgi:hypothetical protein
MTQTASNQYQSNQPNRHQPNRAQAEEFKNPEEVAQAAAAVHDQMHKVMMSPARARRPPPRTQPQPFPPSTPHFQPDTQHPTCALNPTQTPRVIPSPHHLITSSPHQIITSSHNPIINYHLNTQMRFEDIHPIFAPGRLFFLRRHDAAPEEDSTVEVRLDGGTPL